MGNRSVVTSREVGLLDPLFLKVDSTRWDSDFFGNCKHIQFFDDEEDKMVWLNWLYEEFLVKSLHSSFLQPLFGILRFH